MGFEQLTSESLQQICSFLSLKDRCFFLSASKRLKDEPFAVQFASFCGTCGDCLEKYQHRCKEFEKLLRNAGFWTFLWTRCGNRLMELRLAHAPAMDKEMLTANDLKASLSGLRVLDLNKCNDLGAVGLRTVASFCTNLRAIYFRDMQIDPKAFELLIRQNQTTLQVVHLCGCHTVTGENVTCLALLQHTLTDLSFCGSHNIDNKSIIYLLQSCTAVTRLNLRYCYKVNDTVVQAIAHYLPCLRELNLRYCIKLVDTGVKTICAHLPFLENLNLSQCWKITDASIEHIVTSLCCLKELRLWGCTNLTSVSICAISAGLPSLTLVDIRGRDKFEAIIGGPLALKYLIQTYRHTLRQWEQSEQVGVFKRSLSHAIAAS